MARRLKRTETAGTRTGTKRKDYRWTDPAGIIWASRFEYEIFNWFRAAGLLIRKAESPADTVSYTTRIRSGVCGACGADGQSYQRRTYTPDLVAGYVPFIAHKSGSVYIEAKGFLRGKDRSLLRAVVQAGVRPNLCLFIQRDAKVGKGTVSTWARKFLKGVPVCLWTRTGPERLV
jgi:hypothetical protein